MTEQEIKDYLGTDLIVKEIVEDENELFAFYVSKQFEESGGNDRYSLIGVGPFYYNKRTQEKRVLGAMGFHEEYTDRKIIQDNLITYESSFDEVVEKIKKRKHVNEDEFEIIMNSLNIDLFKVSIYTSDFMYETIESSEVSDMDKFRKVFEQAQLEFTQDSPNKIILKNN